MLLRKTGHGQHADLVDLQPETPGGLCELQVELPILHGCKLGGRLANKRQSAKAVTLLIPHVGFHVSHLPGLHF